MSWKWKTARTRRELSLYESSLNELKNDITHKRDQLVELQKRTNSPDLPTMKFQYEQMLQKSSAIMVAMSKTREDLARVMSKLAIYDQSQDKACERSGISDRT